MRKIATILALLCVMAFAQEKDSSIVDGLQIKIDTNSIFVENDKVANTTDTADSMLVKTLAKDTGKVLKNVAANVRSKAEIMQVISARTPSLRNIYNKYLELKPDFSGKVILKFTIAPSGKIVSISIVSSTTGYAEFDNAIKDMVATWKWKVIKSGNTTAVAPFNFTE